MSNTLNELNKRNLEVVQTGIIVNQSLLIPSVSEGFTAGFKLHVHEIELNVSIAALVVIKIGNTIVFSRRNTTANAEYHTLDRDYHNGSEADQTLSISINTAAVVSGFIRYSFQ